MRRLTQGGPSSHVFLLEVMPLSTAWTSGPPAADDTRDAHRPAASEQRAFSSTLGGAPFGTNASAPAASACPLRSSARLWAITRISGQRALIRAVAVIPSRRGMRISRMTTSGRSRFTSPTAFSPSAASPISCRPGCVARTARSARRVRARSSAISSRRAQTSGLPSTVMTVPLSISHSGRTSAECLASRPRPIRHLLETVSCSPATSALALGHRIPNDQQVAVPVS